MPTRRRFIAAAAGLAAAPALTARPAVAGGTPQSRPGRPLDDRPNIVVVLADDLGFGHLGSYGQRLIRTPTLDELAAQGTRFTQAYAAAAVCAPSRASLLTGLHSGHAAVRQNPFGGPQGSLGDDDTTFAEVLRARGYRTACIGKWGFGPDEAGQPSHPNWRGFEEFFGYIGHGHAHQYYPEYLWHNGEKVELPENVDGRKGTYAIDLIQSRANDFVTENAAEPFLLYLTPNVPHAPSDIPEAEEYADRPWPEADRKHAAQVTRLDTLVGSVVDTLRRHGIEERTLVLVTSDNGPHEEGKVDPDLFDANGPLKGYKRNLYEGGVRVPLIAWRPGTVGRAVTDRPTPLIDVLPTLAELAGAPAPRDIDGLSAAALLSRRPGTAPSHEHLYWYRNDPGSTARAKAVDRGRINRLAEAVRRDDWKAVRFAPARDRTAPDESWDLELYDLATDPGETTDLAAERPALVAELTELLRSSWSARYEREGFGVRLQAPPSAAPGEPLTVTATFTNASRRTWTDPGLALSAPRGWRIKPVPGRRRRSLAPGDALESRWEVTPPPGSTDVITPGLLHVRASARVRGVPVRYESRRTVTPPAPGAAR
ncbi:sulfatase-like hydrolase/transferase [Streptomyces sp. NPDC051840]|uniref:sulfatase-like hydrolase/transferase n=1 Tax=Streptomyces sp. NPDC051840 TaxID=3154752 RepID=UPI00342CBFA1